ncbi:MAG: SRPBCC family protein, partial [Vicinamibacteraceae bacterium]
MHTTAYSSDVESSFDPSVDSLERWGALAAGAAIIGYGLSRRSIPGLLMAVGGAPLAYRGVTGRWPAGLESLIGSNADTREALSGDGGINLRESIRLECPVDEVYRFWSRLENLPTFMDNLISVDDLGGGRSHWVATGPGGLRVEWDAEIINEIPNKVLAWKSLPGGDVVSA